MRLDLQFFLDPLSSSRYTAKKACAIVVAVEHRRRLLPCLLLGIAILLTVTGELLLKHGMNRHGVLEFSLETLAPTLVQVFTNPFVLLGFAFVFIAAIFWLSVISRIELSIA